MVGVHYGLHLDNCTNLRYEVRDKISAIDQRCVVTIEFFEDDEIDGEPTISRSVGSITIDGAYVDVVMNAFTEARLILNTSGNK